MTCPALSTAGGDEAQQVDHLSDRGDLNTRHSRHVAARGGYSAILILGSHCNQPGRYQFASPRSVMLAGSRIARITVASMKMALASPKPNCFRLISRVNANISATATMMAAAFVMVPGAAPFPPSLPPPLLSPLPPAPPL